MDHSGMCVCMCYILYMLHYVSGELHVPDLAVIIHMTRFANFG